MASPRTTSTWRPPPQAIVIGFNVKPVRGVQELADREGVDIRYYTVIYQAIDEVEAALKGMLKPEFEEVQTGTAEVREIFRSSKFGNIAGCIVRSGEIRRNAKARLLRGGVVINDNLQIDSLRRFKDDATEVREGFECGIGLGSWNNIEVEDTIETYDVREKPAQLMRRVRWKLIMASAGRVGELAGGSQAGTP